MRIPLKSFVLKHSLETLLIFRINAKYRILKNKRKLTFAQRKSIQNYFKYYCGHKVSLAWHRYMYSRNGIYSVKYIPTSLYRTEMIGRMNRWDCVGVFSDKSISELLLPKVKQPYSILVNQNGFYYSEEGAISREAAIAKCWNLTNAIIKPSLQEGGKGVRALTVVDGKTNICGMSLGDLFDNYCMDFIIQERIMQHPAMVKLNSSSVNTIRVLTYRFDSEVVLLYCVARIGRKGMVVDNESQGGISVKINSDGMLCKYAYGAPGEEKIEKTDEGLVLEGYQIPSYFKIVSLAKECHMQLPYFKLIGWDFCVDYNGDPLLIEWNSNPDLSQTANGPAFGDYTDEILADVYKRCNTRNAHW